MEVTDILQVRKAGKEMFKNGKIQESLRFLELNMLERSRESGLLQDQLESLMVLARLKQEIGEFLKADAHLDEMRKIIADNEEYLKQAISEEKVFYYKAKLFHLTSKNLARQFYHQKAREMFEDGIAFLEAADEKFEKIKYKFLCKLYEGLGHLYCEPLMFDKCEQLLQKAEVIYNEKKDLLTEKQRLQFDIKNASYLKKFGFFSQSFDILSGMENKLTEELKDSKEDPFWRKKLLFKVNRDKARILALKRDEVQANKCHSKAEKIIKQELYSHDKVPCNIKMAKLQLLKGLWCAKFDFRKSNDELIEAYHQFGEILGDEQNYFGANCQLEIGSNYLRIKDPQTCTAFLFRANQVFEQKFGEEHPLMQKYYSYSSEVFSNADDNENMLSMAETYMKIVEKNNISRDGRPSLFILDALLQLISMQCQTQSKNNEMLKNVERMEQICLDNDIVDGNQLLHSAFTMKSIILIREDKLREALEILERTYEHQVKKLKNDRSHPFLEQSISQLGLLYRATQQPEKSEEMYGLLVKIKETYYGEESESLMQVLKNLASIQSQRNLAIESLETLNRAINIALKLQEKNKVKDKQSFKQNSTEIFLMNYTLLDQQKLYNVNSETLNSHQQFMKELHGEKSSQFAFFLFLKSKLMMMNPEVKSEETLEVITQAIQIEEDIQQSYPVKTQQLGRYQYCAGTIYYGQQQFKEALQKYKAAKEILQNHKGYQDLVSELEGQIATLTAKVGDDEEGQDDQNQQETESDSASQMLVIGAIAALAIGVSAFAIMKLKQN